MTHLNVPTAAAVDSDETLMEFYVDGDFKAFDVLYDRYESRVYGFFLRRTGSPERARDLFQELFLRIHRHRDRYERGRPFAPWFFQIARRLLIDDIRRVHRSHEVEFEEERPQTSNARPDPMLESPAPEHVLSALSALSADERRIVIASKVEGVRYDELGVRVGKSTIAVRKIASRAVQKVRRILEHEEALESIGTKSAVRT